MPAVLFSTKMEKSMLQKEKSKVKVIPTLRRLLYQYKIDIKK